MDKRRLVLGLGVLLLICGALLACFSPGGLLHSSGSKTLSTPFGSFSVQGDKSSAGLIINGSETLSTPFGSFSVQGEKFSAGPIIGYVLLGLGAVGLVIAFAMKSLPKP
jgi:hypothetical protein